MRKSYAKTTFLLRNPPKNVANLLANRPGSNGRGSVKAPRGEERKDEMLRNGNGVKEQAKTREAENMD